MPTHIKQITNFDDLMKRYVTAIRKNKNYKKAISQIQKAHAVNLLVCRTQYETIKRLNQAINNQIGSLNTEINQYKIMNKELTDELNKANNKLQVLTLDLAHEKEISESMTNEGVRLKERLNKDY